MVCTKANITLGFLRRNLSMPTIRKFYKSAYIGQPGLECNSSVWDPQGVVLQEELQSVQKRIARFVTGNYNIETGSLTGILGKLKWEPLKKRRKDIRHIVVYTGLKGKAILPTDDLIPLTGSVRNHQPMSQCMRFPTIRHFDMC